jgi:hypothetical protein
MRTLFSSESRKAWLATGIAFFGSLAVAAQSDGLTLAEWLTAVSVSLVALGGVYGITNAAQK